MSIRKLILAMLACLLVLVCAACGSSSDAPSGTEASEPQETEVTEQAEPEESEEPEAEAENLIVDEEFKAALDSYEEFFDEYVAFMKKYQDSDDPMSMMSDFADLSAYNFYANKKKEPREFTELQYFIRI